MFFHSHLPSHSIPFLLLYSLEFIVCPQVIIHRQVFLFQLDLLVVLTSFISIGLCRHLQERSKRTVRHSMKWNRTKVLLLLTQKELSSPSKSLVSFIFVLLRFSCMSFILVSLLRHNNSRVLSLFEILQCFDSRKLRVRHSLRLSL